MLWKAPIFSFLKNVFEMTTVMMLVVVMVVMVMVVVVVVVAAVVVVVVKLSSVQPEKRVRHPHLA